MSSHYWLTAARRLSVLITLAACAWSNGITFADETPPGDSRSDVALIRKALDTKVDLNLVEVPLEQFARSLAKQHGINVVLDRKALEDAGVASDTPLTFKVSGITLRSALKHLLSGLDLESITTDSALTFTTPEKANAEPSTIVYDVRDLVMSRPGAAFNEEDADYESLIDLVTTTLAPTTWDQSGGAGSLKELRGTLAISQKESVHDQIQSLFTALRAALAKPNDREPIWANLPAEEEARRKIEAALDKRVTWNFVEKPLSDVLSELTKVHGLPARFDFKALEDAGAATDNPITFRLANVPLREALRALLRQIDLTYVIQHEMLLVSTPEKANADLNTVVYRVNDLVRPAGGAATDSATEADFESLIEAITTTIGPTMWDESGGPGSIKEFELADSLVLSQTEQMHRGIVDLLTQLRSKRSAAVAAPPVAQGRPQLDDSRLVLRIYTLRDTGVPVRDMPAGMGGMGGGGFGGGGGGGYFAPASTPELAQISRPKDKGKSSTPPAMTAANPKLAAELSVAVTQFVAPSSWTRAQAMIMPVAGKLVVRQTPAVHRQIESFLQAMGTWSGKQGTICLGAQEVAEAKDSGATEQKVPSADTK